MEVAWGAAAGHGAGCLGWMLIKDAAGGVFTQPHPRAALSRVVGRGWAGGRGAFIYWVVRW